MKFKVVAALGVAIALACATQAGANITFSFTGSVQTWTVDTSGHYQIDAWGGQGGGLSFSPGGLGAHVGGDIELIAGETYYVIVAGQGMSNAELASGGGGASWIYAEGAALPLIVAGGGGGADWRGTNIPGPGTITPGNGSGGLAFINGDSGGGGGGGGWFGPGADAGSGGEVQTPTGYPYGLGGMGPASFAGGNSFGTVSYYPPNSGHYNVPSGGFGGGGGGGWTYGGGGGGYTGGDGRMGGSSFLDEHFTNTVATAGARVGFGLITVDFLGVPEPSTWGLLLMGFGGIGACLRRTRKFPSHA